MEDKATEKHKEYCNSFLNVMQKVCMKSSTLTKYFKTNREEEYERWQYLGFCIGTAEVSTLVGCDAVSLGD